MRILFIGDVVGAAGLGALSSLLPPLLSRWQVDVTIVNGENSADGGFGITRDSYRTIREAGADAVTLGNHSWNRKEALELIQKEPHLVRPVNYVPGTPGAGLVEIHTAKRRCVLVINALGRLFMEPADDPFGAVHRTLEERRLVRDVDAIVLDFHCEATSEKQAMGHFCDGRASLVVGTHTHTPSADHRIRPYGTAYITDVGMTGDYNSIVGMERSEPINRFVTGISSGRFVPATGAATMCGVAVETDEKTGLAVRISALRVGPYLEEQKPQFWD
jgi:2',3'-cyclic-nucleotide 2'-phosphodiesterase